MINLKELCKMIKSQANNGTLIWSKEKDRHYITDRHFLTKFDLLPREVLSTLCGVFCRLPTENETFVCQGGQDKTAEKPINYSGIYKPDEQTEKGKATGFVFKSDQSDMRAIKFEKKVVFVAEKYFKLLPGYQQDALSNDGNNLPVFFTGVDQGLLILPYRMMEGAEKELPAIEAELKVMGL